MKKSILFLLALFSVTMTTQATDYYYRGERNNWGDGQKLEVSTDTYYSYIHFDAGAEHQFKICEHATEWGQPNYGKTHNDVGFNGTDVTELGDHWGGDNCKIWSSKAHYVLVYHPNTKINTTSQVKICASTFLPDDSETDLPKPEPEPTELAYNVTVPAGTKACYICGNMTGWNFTEMTKVDDTHYTITIEGAKKNDGYKYASGSDWGYVEKDANGAEIGDRTWAENDVVAKWASVYDPDAVEQELTYSVTVPEGTYACYIAMDTDPAQEGWEFNEMTKVDDTHYTFTRTGLKNKIYKYASGAGWEYVEKTAEDGEVADRTWAENDVVAKWASVYNPTAPTYDYYIAGTLAGGWSATQQGMTKEGDVYKHTFSELNAGEYQFKITDGQWNSEGDATHEHTTLGAAYEEVSYNEGNIKIVTEEAINLTVIFNAATDKITFEGLTEKAPAEPVTVYFINSGNWDEVACYYWGGIEGSAWPGVKMTANGEVYEAEGWNVYKVTFPGDNTACIFTDNKAEGTTQTADLEVQNGKYYCYENGIWYERLADVDPLDTRVYLKGAMNDWCAEYCDMFRKEDKSEKVAYRTVYLEEANTTYEFKIESAGAWLSCAQAVTKDNCTDLTFEEGVSTNCTITTEHAGDYIFKWDMTTNQLSVEYPELVPTVMDLVVTNMEFDGATTFSGSDNEYGIVFNLVVGDPIEEGVFALDASSTVDFGGTPFTNVTGMIAPDMNTFASATAVVYGFLGGSEYFQFNINMSAGGGTPVEIWDGVATPNDGTGELTISATWEGDDVYVVVPGFNYTNYECPEVWFYVGGTTWETASIAAYGPATITVEDGGVLVEGSVMSGVTGTSYTLMVFGLLPVEETPDYTRTVTKDQWGTICLPYASASTSGATFYEVSSLVYGEGLWLDQLAAGTQLVAGKPYIFKATATEITVTYTGEEADAPIEGANGLTGTFTGIAAGSLTGNYIIAENKVWVAGATATLPANCAYINAEQVPTETQAEIPGRRRVCMGENAATGLDQIVAPEGQTVKAIVNGQLIIIRDGVKYNVQGQKL